MHVFGRPELYAARGTFRLRALSLEPVGLGALTARIEELRRKLAAEGLFEDARKRPLPLLPRRIGLLTGADAAAKRDFVTAVGARFPAARILVSETAVQGPRAPALIAAALAELAAEPGIDVVVLSRGGGSFEDLLPFSDERVVRAVAACPVPIVSAVGHEQDTPLCDLAADARASTPTAAARLVVPDEGELRERLAALRTALAREATRTVTSASERVGVLHVSLAREGTRTFARARERLLADRARLDQGARAPRRAAARRPRRPGRPPAHALSPGNARARLRDRARRGRGRPPGRRAERRSPRGGRAGRRRLRRTRRGHPVSEAEPTFEQARAELEKIVAELESGTPGLDEAIALWKRGEELYAVCVGKLDAAQGAVDELAKRAEDARP